MKERKAFVGLAKIYTLADVKGRIFYVGCTIQHIAERVTAHLFEARANIGNKRKNRRIRSLNYNLVVQIVDMKRVEGLTAGLALSQARGLETSYIELYHSLGHNLCNHEKSKVVIDRKFGKEPFIGQTFRINGVGANRILFKEVPREIEAQDITGQLITQ